VIAIIDYKTGNLASVQKAFQAVGARPVVTDDPQVIRSASKLVLPGVGHFSATQKLEQLGLRQPILDSIQAGNPFLGICVGMQWLFERSEEAQEVSGAGLLPGSCSRFAAGLRCPHVGWNRIVKKNHSRLLANVADASFVYFTHSFYAPVSQHTVAASSHGGDFCAAVERGNVFGVQFHAEKSGPSGLQILRNFVELPC
jgi:imidazole glycerol-phosphate synthase subunit HisH